MSSGTGSQVFLKYYVDNRDSILTINGINLQLSKSSSQSNFLLIFSKANDWFACFYVGNTEKSLNTQRLKDYFQDRIRQNIFLIRNLLILSGFDKVYGFKHPV